MWLKYLLPGALLVIAACTLPLLFSNGATAFAIFLAVLLLVEAVVIWRFMGRMSRVEVSLGEEAIIYRGKNGVLEIPYGEISAIEQPSIRYTGGWLKVVAGSKVIRLTVALAGIGEFVRELKARLDGLDLADHYQRAKLFNFFKTAENSDQSGERLYQMLWKKLLVLVAAAIAGWLVGHFFVEQNPDFRLTLNFVFACWLPVVLTLSYAGAEIALARRFGKIANEDEFSVPERDRPAEKRIYRRALAIGVAAAVVMVAVAVLK